MQDKDCCENCIYFLEGDTTMYHRGCPSRVLDEWVEESYLDKARRIFVGLPRRRRVQPELVVETYQVKERSVCRKTHVEVVKHKSEWCGEYKAKD